MTVAGAFWAMLAISFCCFYVALRARSWPFALAAFLLVAPISLLSFALYVYLTLWACLLMALAVGLRWSVSAVCWLGLVLAATALWFVGIASGPILHWPREFFWILLFGILVGLFSLVVPRAPWAQPRR
jgi:hypothetical protein